MRYIDNTSLPVSKQWREDAADALAKVKDAKTKAERNEVINKFSHLWKALKDILKEKSAQKCWYCETREVRNDDAVDHYRPKGNVHGAQPAHDGYWWLAFDPANYRFACTFCNSVRIRDGVSGGKQDAFPLSVESRRARTEKDTLEEEDPLLLDPTKVVDVRQIAFNDDGTAAPAVSEPRGQSKASQSIKAYHLNERYLIESRLMVIEQVKRWIKEADRQLELSEKARDDRQIFEDRAESRIADLVRAGSDDAPYSSAVRYVVRALRQISRAAREAYP